MNKILPSKKSLHHDSRDMKISNRKRNIDNPLLKDPFLMAEHWEILGATPLPENESKGPSVDVINSIISYSRALGKVEIAEPEFRLMIRN